MIPHDLVQDGHVGSRGSYVLDGCATRKGALRTTEHRAFMLERWRSLLSGFQRRAMMLALRLEQETAVCDQDLLAILEAGRQGNCNGEELQELTDEECKARGDRLRAIVREIRGTWGNKR